MDKYGAKRFYKSATVDSASLGVRLDQSVLKTPAGLSFSAPTRALAEAIAREWDAQGEYIAPSSLPLSQLAFSALDQTSSRRHELIDFAVKYSETDLTCHRAAAPAELVARQAAAWDPLVAWAERRFGVRLAIVAGVIAAGSNEAVQRRLRELIAAYEDFRLTALAHATGVAGSVVIALALMEGEIDADAAFSAATVDERWNMDQWGEDGEARARLDVLQRAFTQVESFIGALAL